MTFRIKIMIKPPVISLENTNQVETKRILLTKSMMIKMNKFNTKIRVKKIKNMKINK